MLIVYTIGFAAFAIRPAIGTDASQPLTTEELLDKFANGLRWLLAGIVHERVLIRGSPSSLVVLGIVFDDSRHTIQEEAR